MISDTTFTITDSSMIPSPQTTKSQSSSPFVELKETKKRLEKTITEKFTYKIKLEQLEDEYKKCRQEIVALTTKNRKLSEFIESKLSNNSTTVTAPFNLDSNITSSPLVSQLKEKLEEVQYENETLKSQLRSFITKTQIKETNDENNSGNQTMTSLIFDKGETMIANAADILSELEILSKENAQLKIQCNKLENENMKLKQENEQLLRDVSSNEDLFEKYNQSSETILNLQNKLKENEITIKELQRQLLEAKSSPTKNTTNQEELENIKKDNQKLKKEIENLNKKAKDEFAIKESLELQLAKMEDDHNEQIKRFQKENNKNLNKIKSLETKIKELQLINDNYAKITNNNNNQNQISSTPIKDISLMMTPMKITESEEYQKKYEKAKIELNKKDEIIEQLSKENAELKSFKFNENDKELKEDSDDDLNYDNLHYELQMVIEQNNRLIGLFSDTTERLSNEISQQAVVNKKDQSSSPKQLAELVQKTMKSIKEHK